MEFEKVNLAFLIGMIGLIAIALSLIYTRQDGYAIKAALVLIGVAMGLPIELPDMFKGKKE
jgi:hypothetical protein